MGRWTLTAFVFNPQPSPAVNPRLNWSLGGSRWRLKYSEPFVTNRAAPDLLCINRGPVELCIGDQMNSALIGDQYVDSCIGEVCIDQVQLNYVLGTSSTLPPTTPPPYLCYCLGPKTAGATILCSAHYGFHLFSANVAEISHLHLDFNLCLIFLMGIGKT